MIAYDLTCKNGHTFEGWFEDAKAFEAQKGRDLVSCPICSDTSVEIVPSLFAIKSMGTQSKENVQKETNSNSKKIQQPSPLEIVYKKVVESIEKNSEDVGPNFSKEALKMHYGVTEKRNIRGTSTAKEEEMLDKEGVKYFKIPMARWDT